MNIGSIVIRNGLWLLLPVMIWNAILATKLPPAFSPQVFWRAIPSLISIPENIVRIALFALPSITVCGAFSTHKRGYIIFALGLMIYFGSWLALICAPESDWSHSAAGFLAPAYTPLLWLVGIALMTDSFIGAQRPVRMGFLALGGIFLVFHISHTYFVYHRECHGTPNRVVML